MADDVLSDFLVKPECLRPGYEDVCYYCSQPLGGRHKVGCVLLRRRIIVRVSVDVVEMVPADWDVEMIDFRFNKSGWCVDNIIPDVMAKLKEARRGGGCLCSVVKIAYVSETDGVVSIGE